MRKLLCIILLSCIHLVVHAQTLEELGIDLSRLPQKTYAESMRYWFDDDIGTSANGIGLTEMHNVDASSLKDGIHILHLQIADNEGIWGIPYSSVFMKTSIAEMAPVKELRYWFNDDRSIQKTGNASGSILSIDASRLPDGVHTFHCQVIDELGISSHIMSSIFLKVEAAVNFSAKKLRYWFDDDHALITNIHETGGMLSIYASILQDGVHTFHCQVIDGTGISSHIASSIFVKAGSGANLSAKKLLYWFDDESSFSELDMSGGIQTLDASMLLEGLHTMHYQVVCSDGTLTSAHSALFMRMNVDEQAAKISKLRYWYDDNHDATEISATNGVQMLDASGLLQGLHTFHYQTVDVTGALGTPMSSLFMKIDFDVNESAVKKQRYWFDDDIATLYESDIASGTQTLDASGLGAGLHILHYQQIDDAGNVSVPYNALFMKMAESSYAGKENVITKYMYWTNDLSANNVKVNIGNPTKSFSLISLLPVVKAPIRSSNFQFEVRNGKPMMFAKNDIHVRFCDSYGYWVDDSRSFLDYSVMQEITNIANLQTTQTFTRPEENGIKWFKFEAAPGDTISFKASQATTMQVFAPSGKEILSTMGDKSVQYTGAHTWEDGTYYVAVHDVTGSKPSVTLDYMHMDKYDVVAQDVRVVGNGGCSTITFQGNGFRDLYAVDLYTALGDTIHNEHIDYISDATVSIRFNFTYAPLGEYMALFHFTEGKKELNYCVGIEEAQDMKLSYDVTYASQFLRGTANTYAIKIKNSGNSTAYQVPLKIQLQAEGGTKDITYIKLSDNLYSDSFEWLDDESIPEKDRDELLALVEQKGNMLDFITINDSIENVEYMEGYFAINLLPKTTTTFTISVKSNSVVTIYTLLPDEWDYYAYSEENLAKARRIRKASVKESMCCARTHVECGMNIIATGLDYASVAGGPGLSLASCVASFGNTWIPFAYDMWCGETSNDKNEAKNSLYRNTISTLISCASKYDPYKIGWMIQHVNDVITTATSCFSHPKSIPNCPPKPPKPHPSTPVNSLDPNDIFGYTAESGSKFVADSIVGLNYRIEFENDTTFATASAHVVEIRDTLDSRVLDLATFAPTSIKIGEKTESLDGTPNFHKTIDMRPAINAIAQVEGKYDAQKGIATWLFTSLDPMTMEPTDDVMQGFLPVNYDGVSGIGEVSFDINRKSGLADGTEINNRASIIFDANEPILTPVWTNIIDAVAPESSVIDVTQQGDSAIITCEGTDERSGIWKYEVYTQPGINAPWIKVGECFADSATISCEVFADIDYGFCALAVDSAGNVEKKELEREFSLNPILYGDVNGDGSITISDAVGIVNFVIHANTSSLNEAAADANEDGEVTITDAVFVVNRVIHSNQKNKNLYEKETNYRVTGTRRHANAQ